MAGRKFIQLFRNEIGANTVFENKAVAKSKLLSNNISPDVLKDGMPIVARYYADSEKTTIKSLLGIAHVSGKTVTVTVFDSSSAEDIDATISAKTSGGTEITIVQENGALKSVTLTDIDNEKLSNYEKGTDSGAVATSDSISQAIAKLENRIGGEIEGLDSNVEASVNQHFTKIDIVDGKLSTATTKANIDIATLADYSAQAGGFISTADTIHGAFEKLEDKILDMDVAAISGEGQAITAVSQSDGTISAVAGDIAAAHVTTVTGSTTFTGTTAQAALDELAGKINKNSVSSADKTVTITTTGDTTDLSVNIDNLTVVKNANGVISTGLKLVKAAGTGTTKETYTLTDSAGTAVAGDVITINKDQAFVTAQLGHSGATVDASTGTITDGPSTGEDVLILEYINAEGNYMIVEIPLGSFLKESEFKDGLQVSSSGEVSVKVDSTSESVVTGKTGDTEESAPVLSVSSDGVKVSNIQAAIDYATSKGVSELDASVTGGTTAGTASQDHIQVVIDEVDGKLTAVTVTETNIADADDLSALSAKTVTEIASSNSSISAVSSSTTDGTVKYDIVTDASKIQMSGFTADTSGFTGITEASSITDAVKVIEGEFIANEQTVSAALNDLEERKIVNINVNGVDGDVASNVASVTIDGADIKLDGYASGSSSADVVETDTVNQAIGKLENKIAAGTGNLQEEVDAIELAVGLGTGGTHTASAGHYTSGASTIEGEIVALDSQLSAVSNSYISSAVSGNNAISVVMSANAESGKTATIGLVLDDSTTSTPTTAQYATDSGNALQVTNDGLYLDSSWDCGYYA